MSESHLMEAVRDRIRAHDDFEDRNVNVEWDELAPATAPDVYVIVMHGTVEAGPVYNGFVEDLVHGVNVSVAIRAPMKPRDRKRDIWLANTRSFYRFQKSIAAQIDQDYTTISLANTYMIRDSEATGTCDTFLIPLRLQSIGPIRAAPAEMFAGIGDAEAALIRTMRFRGARRLAVLT